MGKAIIIYVLGTLTIFLTLNTNVNQRISSSVNSVSENFSDVSARNIANSMAEMLIAEIGNNKNFRVSNWTLKSMFGGEAYYRVVDTVITADTLIKISIKANYFNLVKNVDVLGKSSVSGSPGFLPGTVKAAISTNNNVQTLGNLVVDGRDHDINGNLIGGQGTYAIWTTGSYSRSGNSHLGSTVSETDYSLAKVENNNYRLESQSYPGGYPTSPDGVLGGAANGFTDGTLKALSQSGWNGSQYVTNPSSLTFPLSGVTYVELTSGGTWNPANINGSGILIVHNTSGNAKIKNLNSGTFKGLLIADDIIHIHTNIIGAVVALSPSPSDGNCIGNGNGDVLFSRAAINQATTNLKLPETVGYGFGKKRIQVVRWFE
ncbi:MAG: hypothetical protein RDU14_16175 [Melioribacteraceae bacterium]|nr:hypothetical protein [Melioribacteraceae bacterium]